MQILFSDFKKGIVKVKVLNPEDLWYLSQIIQNSDFVSSITQRKVALGDEKKKYSLKTFFVKLCVESVELGSTLRISGKIVDAPDDIPKGSYHTISPDIGKELTIEKPEWLPYHKLQLQDASRPLSAPILICVFDRDEAIIAVSREQGIKILSKHTSNLEKKDKRALSNSDFYPALIKAIKEYSFRLKPDSIVIASPGFYNEDLAKQITDKELKKKMVFATCSSANENALQEVLKRPETKTAFQQARVAEEAKLIERLLVEISKENLATYGFDEVRNAADSGAISELLVTDEFIKQSRESKTFNEVNSVMKSVDNAGGNNHIINSAHYDGKKLQGLGGIAAILRYKIK